MCEPTIFDDDGVPETVYLSRSPALVTDEGWLVSSMDVGSWRPLNVGDRLVALDRDTPDEFLVEVADVTATSSEVYYMVRWLADFDPAAEPGLDDTRT